MEEIRKLIREYLQQDMTALKRYFNASDEQKAEYLPHEYPWLFSEFLDSKYEGEDEEELKQEFDTLEDDPGTFIENLESKNKDVFDQFAEFLFDGIKNNRFGSRIHDAEIPTWSYYSEDPEIIKNQWLIHFTNPKNAYDISQNGFKKGVYDMEKLGLTTYLSKFEKSSEGYNFAYTVKDFKKYAKSGSQGGSGDYKYGEVAILFKASGLRVYHYGDEEYQTIFYGNTANNINIIECDAYTDEFWHVDNKKTGRVLYKNEDLEKVVDWVISHYEQYRKNLNESLIYGFSVDDFKSFTDKELIEKINKISEIFKRYRNKEYLSNEDIESAIFIYHVFYYNIVRIEQMASKTLPSYSMQELFDFCRKIVDSKRTAVSNKKNEPGVRPYKVLDENCLEDDNIIREIIRNKIDLLLESDMPTAASRITDENLANNMVKQMFQKTQYGTPYYTFGKTAKMVKNYINKQEKGFKEHLSKMFRSDVHVEHIKDEVQVYKDSKQLMTINLEPNRLKSSFLRFDFMKPKFKEKIPINASPQMISDIINKHKDKFEQYGLSDIFK